MGEVTYFLNDQLEADYMFSWENLSSIFDSRMLMQNLTWKWLFLCLQGIYYPSSSSFVAIVNHIYLSQIAYLLSVLLALLWGY